MKEFTIGPNDAGQRLDRFLAKAVPLLPASLAQKYIRLKRIKCNGKRIDRDTRLNEGDVLQLYINDEFFDKPREDNAYLTVANPKLNIVYEDDHILLVDKRPGLAVHPHDGADYGKTLIDHILAYLLTLSRKQFAALLTPLGRKILHRCIQLRIVGKHTFTEISAHGISAEHFSQHHTVTVQRKTAVFFVKVGTLLCDQLTNTPFFLFCQLPYGILHRHISPFFRFLEYPFMSTRVISSYIGEKWHVKRNHF